MSEPRAKTILEAVVAVLSLAGHPLSAKEIHDRIVKKELFTFGARDPVGMVRAAIRKHTRSAGSASQVKQIEKDSYGLPEKVP